MLKDCRWFSTATILQKCIILKDYCCKKSAEIPLKEFTTFFFRSHLRIRSQQITVIAQYFPSLLVVLLYERSISCHSEDPLCAIPLWRSFQSHLSSYFLDRASSVLRASLTTNRPLASLYLLCQCDTVCHHSNLLQPSPPTPRGQLFLYFHHNLQTVRQCAATKVCCHIAVWEHTLVINITANGSDY